MKELIIDRETKYSLDIMLKRAAIFHRQAGPALDQ